MNKTRVSKAYRGEQHVGFKKTVAHREWFLVYGITPADEAKAISLVEVLEAKWKLIKASGGVSQPAGRSRRIRPHPGAGPQQGAGTLRRALRAADAAHRAS